MMRMKRLFILLSVCFFLSCGKHPDNNDPVTPTPTPGKNEGVRLMERLWTETTPLQVTQTRLDIFDAIQALADQCTNTSFKNLIASDANKYALTVKYDDMFSCYDVAFDRVLDALKAGHPQKGTAVIWLLYNMGYVIQTPTANFGIDIYHYRAAELEPYLDFVGSTHKHQDHRSDPLQKAMYKAGKPVMTNYYSPVSNYQYMSTATKDYEVAGCKIHTFITKHNNSADSNVPITVFQVDCGEDAGGLVLMHSGDSNFTASEYDVTKKINVYIPRYAVNELQENQVLGPVFTPDYVLLSHILELSHKDISESRWSFELALDRASKLNCDKTYVPFWGEKLIWENGQLK